MPDKNEDDPKIIVDSDWKEEARREKEEADRETRDAPEAGRLPDPSFPEIIQMIVLQASMTLGGIQDPKTGQRIPPNLPVAKHYIDLLTLLQDKTRGNLDDDEAALIERVVHELRMAFVQVAGAGSQAAGPPPAQSSDA